MYVEAYKNREKVAVKTGELPTGFDWKQAVIMLFFQ